MSWLTRLGDRGNPRLAAVLAGKILSLAAAFREADAALQDYRPPGGVEDARYMHLADRVNQLWPTVPWWVRL